MRVFSESLGPRSGGGSRSWRLASACLVAAALLSLGTAPVLAEGGNQTRKIEQMGSKVEKWNRDKDGCMNSVKRSAKAAEGAERTGSDESDRSEIGKPDKAQQAAIDCVTKVSIDFDAIWLDMDKLIGDLVPPFKAGDLSDSDLSRMSMIRSDFWTGGTDFLDEIFDGDLDGYLLVGSGNNVDGAYLPRNYDNDIPGQNADLPLRRN